MMANMVGDDEGVMNETPTEFIFIIVVRSNTFLCSVFTLLGERGAVRQRLRVHWVHT
jgi:hypothetical protein